MKVNKLMELLEKLNPESEIKIGGWKEHSFTSRYAWDSEALQEKHLTFSYGENNAVTLHVEYDV